NLFYPVLKWLGFFHSLAKIRITPGLKGWLADFNPEIVYLQVSTRDTILFAMELKEYLKVPSVIHIMDDWPSTVSKRGILNKYWDRIIDREFRKLLDGTDLFLSISEAMSSEYRKRYAKDFIAFHNPIDIQFWTQKSKTDHMVNKEHVKVLFSGRIGIGVAESLLDLGLVVESLNNAALNVKLYIQSPSNDKKILDRLRKLKSVVINPVAEYSELPAIFSNADILAITNDFDRESIDYLKYSMPTKASEYMISGTPILVYSHSETAVSRFFTANKCGYCISERNSDKLRDGLMLLIENEQYRQDISANAVMIAKELFDANTVRLKFQDLLRTTSLIKK
ncbi:MAG: glycosyltransferase, partial [Bacteroidales bacterium]|nr:glycosyltransferase [Bacteroidales bacterium]